MFFDSFKKKRDFIIYNTDCFVKKQNLNKISRKLKVNLSKNILHFNNLLSFTLVFFMTIFVLYELNYLIKKSDYFKVEDIVIKGNDKVSKESILKIAGINVFDSLYSVNKNEIKKNILTNPIIKNVRVTKSLDNKITLNIEERQPAYITVAGNGKRYILSKDGAVISDVFDGIKTEKNIVLTGLFPAVPKFGIKANKEKFQKAKIWVSELRKLGFNNISEIYLGDSSNYYFRLKNGIKIFVNSTKELELKASFLKQILKNINYQKLYIEYIDLRVNRGLILKPY